MPFFKAEVVFSLTIVIAGHSRPKDGVLSHAYDPAIHEASR